MKNSFFLRTGILLAFAGTSATCPNAIEPPPAADTVFVASTPGDAPLRAMLGIGPEAKIDFVRWRLSLPGGPGAAKTYTLEISFGESKPNTPGFREGREKILTGRFSMSALRGRTVWQLENTGAPAPLRLLQINENLCHILTAEGNLMVGNGGWSCTLNRLDPRPTAPGAALPAPFDPPEMPADTARTVVLVGRTPCREIAAEQNLQPAGHCIKLKWKLTLHRDPATFLPTTCTMRRVVAGTAEELRGTWAIEKGAPDNPGAVVYRLDLEAPGPGFFLLLGDRGVLFLLDRERRPFVGSEDFSFTFNRSEK